MANPCPGFLGQGGLARSSPKKGAPFLFDTATLPM